jgi:RNA polymerase sigma factor (sigma-70 family)
VGSDETGARAGLADLVVLRRSLLRRAKFLTRSAHDAEDLVQSALERLCRTSGADLSTQALTLLSQTIVRRLAIDRSRSASRWQLIELTDESSVAAGSGSSDPWHAISPQQLQAALQRCAALDREAFELHYGQGLRYVEIAAQLGIAMGTVATRLHRVRAQLRMELGHLLHV